MLNASATAWKYDHVGDYLAVIKKGFAHCKAGGTVRLRWNDEPMNLEAFRREFMKALHCRINLKVGKEPKMRKLDPDYQVALRRDQGRVQDILRIRLRIYRFDTKEVNARYGHLLASHDD